MTITKKFIESITSQQLEEFIEAVFDYTDIDILDRIFNELDSDIKICYESFFGTEDDAEYSEEQLKQIKTNDKFSEDFHSLIGDIDYCITDLGDEEGKYVTQEHHWESPEFDAWEFSSELEGIFNKMLPLLDKAYELELEDKDFLKNILEEIVSGIDSYPEWMGAEYAEFELDKKGAECVLKWNWINRKSVKSFITQTKEFHDTKPCTSRFSQSFLQNESKEKLKELYNELYALKKVPEWAEKIDNTNSIWHDIYHVSEQEADEKAFLESSQKMINKKWKYGIPVYENYKKFEDFINAEKYCALTVSEFFRQNTYGDFDTNINQTIYATHCSKSDSRLDKIFTDWLELCKTLDMPEKSGAIEVQYDFYLKPYDWKRLITLFLNNKSLSCYDNYLREWKLFVQRKTLQKNYSSDISDDWLNWLIDFLLDENKQNFISKTAKWLESPIKVTSSFDRGKHYQLLLRLSKDILPATEILNSYTTLKSYIVKADHSSFDFYDFGAKDPSLKELNNNRLAYLKQTGAESLKENIINAWKNNVHKFIPSPSEAHKANYSRQAKWLAIAKELNPDTYRKFHNNWKSEHWRKRNLWSSLNSYGIHK